jgi:hypothetical protein
MQLKYYKYKKKVIFLNLFPKMNNQGGLTPQQFSALLQQQQQLNQRLQQQQANAMLGNQMMGGATDWKSTISLNERQQCIAGL